MRTLCRVVIWNECDTEMKYSKRREQPITEVSFQKRVKVKLDYVQTSTLRFSRRLDNGTFFRLRVSCPWLMYQMATRALLCTGSNLCVMSVFRHWSRCTCWCWDWMCWAIHSVWSLVWRREPSTFSTSHTRWDRNCTCSTSKSFVYPSVPPFVRLFVHLFIRFRLSLFVRSFVYLFQNFHLGALTELQWGVIFQRRRPSPPKIAP